MPSTSNALNPRQRISDFQKIINSRAKQIRAAGKGAWKAIKAKDEVGIIRAYLREANCGTDYLNKKLAPLLSQDGRVVKFASIFLHQKPKVKGWTGTPANCGSACELGDLQTLFLYVDRRKRLCQARSVIFQAKLKPAGGTFVIDNVPQRQLYDLCDGFAYETALPSSEIRILPVGESREKALQYLFVGKKPVIARTIPSDANQGASTDFGEHLLRFLNNSSGLEVTRPPQLSPWSQIVWDVVDHVAFTAVGKGQQAFERNSGLQTLLDHFNSFENRDHYFAEGSSEGLGEGFGVQLMIVWDGEIDDESEGNAQTRIPPISPQGFMVGIEHDAFLREARRIIEKSDPENEGKLLSLASRAEREIERKLVLEALAAMLERQEIRGDEAERILAVLLRVSVSKEMEALMAHVKTLIEQSQSPTVVQEEAVQVTVRLR